MKQTLTILVACVVACQSIIGVTVGPRVSEDKPLATSVEPTKTSYVPLDIPDLDLAVIVFDANVDEFEGGDPAEQQVWPELRRTEAIRAAIKTRDAIRELQQFASVIVFPDTSVSADLFLLGKLEKSTGEDMQIRWQLIDATGREWVKKRKSNYRVPAGWHQRFGAPGKDSFQPLYDGIAHRVYGALAQFARRHADKQAENNQAVARGRSPKYSELDEIVMVRKLVLAQVFAPGEYSHAVVEKNPGTSMSRLKLRSVPDMNSATWLRMEGFQARDASFTHVMNAHYDAFAAQINPVYETWLADVHPVAREIRIRNARQRAERVLSVAALITSVAIAADAASTSGQDTALAVGGAITGGLLAKSFVTAEGRQNQVRIFNEMAESYHDTFKPMRIELEGNTVELQGTATEQFAQWRRMLKDIYEKEAVDPDAVQIVAVDGN